jgi:hypothetical protein
MAHSLATHGEAERVGSARRAGANEVSDADVAATFRKMALHFLGVRGRSSSIPWTIPTVNIGEAELVDRREIEDYLAIEQALHVYASDDKGRPRPLNVAVFGAPGSGKSFAVKQIAAHLSQKGGERRLGAKPMSFNLGEFKSADELPAALHLVRNQCLSHEIPIVIFDEFDCSFCGQPFGWLKYLIAPMQDGAFFHSGQSYTLGQVVFVFAGGINRSFEVFDSRARNPDFCEAKGPDFISRLRVHLDVQGIDKPQDEGDQARYILRRAILLRSMLCEKLGVSREQACRELLHESVARAFLRVERFKHGVRSLESIIKMSTCRNGQPVGPSDLPSMDQLEMHVDAAKFLELIDSDPDASEKEGENR